MLLAASELRCPERRWISLLPQHGSCRFTGASSFDGVKPPQSCYKALARCSSLCFITFALCCCHQSLSVKQDLGKRRGKLGRLLSDTLHLWFHFSCPDCGALGAGNHIFNGSLRKHKVLSQFGMCWMPSRLL